MSRDKINLVLISDKAMTFNADDYMKLRKDHRIIGRLVGVAPPFPRNVNLLHLPAVYSDFETRLMIEEDIANVQNKNLSEPPTEEMKQASVNHQKEILNELQDSHIKHKLESTVLKLEQIVMGKRRKLIKSGMSESDIHIDPETILKEEEEKHRQSFNTQNLYSQIPTEHQFKCDTQTICDYPVDNMAKYQVFRDLWKKGLYITNADNFGGDFLTYNADPMYFHATQIVHVVDRNELLEPHFISSCGRISVSVKKKCIFAYVHNDKVIYQCLEWDNPKQKVELDECNSQENIAMDEFYVIS